MGIRKQGVIVSLVLLGLLVTGLASHAQNIKEHDFKFALQSARESAQVISAQRFADIVKQKTNGKITIKVYDGGVLGTDVSTLSAMQGGTIDFSLMGFGTLGGHDKSTTLFDLPFLFNTEQEVDRVVDGPVGQKVFQKLPPKGLLGLSYAELGFMQFHNSKRPIIKLEDFQGLKLRAQTMPVVIETINALGANAVPMPFGELYTALEQKVVDGASSPFDNIASGKFYEVNKYLSISNHLYIAMAFLMSKKTWDTLSPDEQKIIQEAGIEAGKFERQANRAANERRLEELKKTMQVNVISPPEIARMREKVKPVAEKWGKEAGIDLYNEMNAELAKIRSGK
jgi:tripartite ATP-independent transporter DctP family solute receptor